MRLSQTRKVTSLSIPITLEHVLGPQNVWVLAAACCSINVGGEAGNGARVQGTWEMLGIEIQPTGWPTLEEERVMGQSLPEDKPPSWCHKTHTLEQRGERDCISRWESLAGRPHVQLGASPGGAVRMSRNGGVPLQAVGRV